ncbi:MAG: hypothetical protein ACRD2A_26155 [Vicinamibacterales bacterium]
MRRLAVVFATVAALGISAPSTAREFSLCDYLNMIYCDIADPDNLCRYGDICLNGHDH